MSLSLCTSVKAKVRQSSRRPSCVLPATASADARVSPQTPCVAYANAGANFYSGSGTQVITENGDVVVTCHLTLVYGTPVSEPLQMQWFVAADRNDGQQSLRMPFYLKPVPSIPRLSSAVKETFTGTVLVGDLGLELVDGVSFVDIPFFVDDGVFKIEALLEFDEIVEVQGVEGSRLTLNPLFEGAGRELHWLGSGPAYLDELEQAGPCVDAARPIELCHEFEFTVLARLTTPVQAWARAHASGAAAEVERAAAALAWIDGVGHRHLTPCCSGC